MILYVRKPKYKGLVFKVKTYGGLDSWNTRWLSGGGSIPLKTVKNEKKVITMKGTKVIPTSLCKSINKHGNSRFADIIDTKRLRSPLDNSLYVIAKRKAIEVYSSRTHNYLGNVYFRGNYFEFSAHLKNKLYKLPFTERMALTDSLRYYLRRKVDAFIFRG